MIDLKPTAAGFYYCPFNCPNGDYPRRKWKTLAGVQKHITECFYSPALIAQREIEKDRREAEVQEKKERFNAAVTDLIKTLPLKIGDVRYAVVERITAPTHEQRGSRLVRVRYEAKKEWDVKKIIVETIGGDYQSYYSATATAHVIRVNGIKYADLFETEFEARKEAQQRKTAYDKGCREASLFR